MTTKVVTDYLILLNANPPSYLSHLSYGKKGTFVTKQLQMGFSVPKNEVTVSMLLLSLRFYNESDVVSI